MYKKKQMIGWRVHDRKADCWIVSWCHNFSNYVIYLVHFGVLIYNKNFKTYDVQTCFSYKQVKVSIERVSVTSCRHYDEAWIDLYLVLIDAITVLSAILVMFHSFFNIWLLWVCNSLNIWSMYSMLIFVETV